MQVQLFPVTTGEQVFTADAASLSGCPVIITSVPRMSEGVVADTGTLPETVIVCVLDELPVPGSRSPVTVANSTTGAGNTTAKELVALPAP